MLIYQDSLNAAVICVSVSEFRANKCQYVLPSEYFIPIAFIANNAPDIETVAFASGISPALVNFTVAELVV